MFVPAHPRATAERRRHLGSSLIVEIAQKNAPGTNAGLFSSASVNDCRALKW